MSGGNDKNLFVWNQATGATINSKLNAHSSNILCVKAMHNGFFASGSMDDTIKIWNPSSMTSPNQTLTGHSGDVLVLEQLTNGFLVSGSNDQYAIVWDPSDWSQINKFVSVNNKNVTCLKEIGTGVFAAGGTDDSIYIWRLDGPNAQTLISTVGSALATVNPCSKMMMFNKSLLAVATNTDGTKLYNVANPSSVGFIKTLKNNIAASKSNDLASLSIKDFIFTDFFILMILSLI